MTIEWCETTRDCEEDNLTMNSLKMLCLVAFLGCCFSWAGTAHSQDYLMTLDYAAFAPSVQTALKKADALISEGRFDEALSELRTAERKEQDERRKNDISVRVAIVSLYRGRVGYARFLLNKINRDVFNSRALIAAARSYIYYPPYDRQEGRKRLKRVLQREEENWQALTELGYCDFFLGNYDEAKKSFKKALKINKNNMRAFYGLADILVKKKKHMEAIHLLEEALRVRPEYAATMKKIGDIYMGSRIKRKLDSAVSWYDRALEYAPKKPRYLAAMMLAFFCRYTAGNAMPYYERLKDVAPSSSYLTWADGVLLELKGRVGAARQKYKEAVEQDSRNWYAYFSLGNVYSGRGNEEYVRWAKTQNYKYDRHGNTKKGIEVFRKIKNNAPTFPFIRVVEDWYQFLLERPTSRWIDPAFKEKLQRMRSHAKALRKGMY